jgi:hypothetical protein
MQIVVAWAGEGAWAGENGLMACRFCKIFWELNTKPKIFWKLNTKPKIICCQYFGG